jgi:malonyl-CoA O-methyltransferase
VIAEKLLLRHSFGRAAPRYDEAADYQREAGQRLMAECDIDIAPQRVLDAGCGTGHGLRLVAARWPAAQCIALDFAAPMLGRIPPGLAAPVCADIEKLPLANDSVDLLWSSLAMQWCDMERIAQEAQRVLRAGGNLALCTLGPATFRELRSAFAGVDAFRHTNDFFAADAIADALRGAGLTPTRTKSVEMVRHFADLRALLASVRDLGANHVVPGNRRPGLMGKRAWQRFAANYEGLRSAAGLPLTYDTYFVVARK